MFTFLQNLQIFVKDKLTRQWLDWGVHTCWRQAPCFTKDLLAWIFHGAEILVYLSAIVRGSSFGRRSSSGLVRSGNTRWTACRPPRGTPTSGRACRSRRRVPCEFRANLPQEKTNFGVSIDSGTQQPHNSCCHLLKMQISFMETLQILFINHSQHYSTHHSGIIVLCLSSFNWMQSKTGRQFHWYHFLLKEVISAVLHIWIQMLFKHQWCTSRAQWCCMGTTANKSRLGSKRRSQNKRND